MKLFLGDFSKLPLFVKKNVGNEPLSPNSGKLYPERLPIPIPGPCYEAKPKGLNDGKFGGLK